MNIIQLSNPTLKEYNLIKKAFGELLNEYHFLLNHEIWEQKKLYFIEDMNICRFNMISVQEINGYTNPDCKIKEVDFIDFMIIINKQFKIFSVEEEKAWRNDTSDKIALELTKKIQ